MKAKGIYEPSQPPSMSLTHGEYLGSTGRQGSREKGVRIGNGEDHADSIGPKRGVINVTRRPTADPKLGTFYREPKDQRAIRRRQPIRLEGAKRSGVKFGRTMAVGYIQPRGKRSRDHGVNIVFFVTISRCGSITIVNSNYAV